MCSTAYKQDLCALYDKRKTFFYEVYISEHGAILSLTSDNPYRSIISNIHQVPL